jgi:hypothetical protein
MTPLLSIMLPTTTDRRKTFYQLLEIIMKQINKLDASELVEVLIDEDNKEKSIGKKRQDLLERTTGKYVVGIDSDDSISIDYLESILDAIKNEDVDCVGFLIDCDMDGVKKNAISSIVYSDWCENKDGYDYCRSIYHKTPVKSIIAKKIGFEDKRFGEDYIYSMGIKSLLKKEHFINSTMYYYRFKNEEHNKKYGII